jgi:radical SAM protein with 4Fe4S-binding SPASM domain
LDFNKGIEILDEAKDLSINGNYITTCNVTGNGEGLLYDKFVEFVHEAKKRFKRVEMITNGYLLSDEKIKGLLHSGIDFIAISITGITQEIYSKFQGSGVSFEQCQKNLTQVINNIINLVKMRDAIQGKTKIYCRYIKTKETKGHFKEYVKFWKSRGIDGIFVTNLYDFHKQTGAVKRCIFSPRGLLIYATGRVRPCSCGYDSSDMGNVNQISLKSILTSEKYLTEIKNRMSRDIETIPQTCRGCEHRRSLPFGLAIRNMRQKILFNNPVKNFIYKLYGPSVILFDYITRCKLFYDLFLVVVKYQSRRTKIKFEKQKK